MEGVSQHMIVSGIIAGAVFAAIDLMWLSLTKELIYRRKLGDMMRKRAAAAPSIAFYALYAVAMAAFAVTPSLAANTPLHALQLGLLLGAVAYGTYNLTNAATLADWPWPLSIIDWSWGTFATGIAAWCSAWLVSYLGINT